MVVLGEVGGVVCMGVVVALRLWGVLGVLGLVMVGVDRNWVKELGVVGLMLC